MPLDDLHINGKLTLGENIADLGGVTIAYAAYQKSLGGKPAPVIDGFTGPQRFFIGYAKAWRGSIRDAELRLLLRTDPHSPIDSARWCPSRTSRRFTKPSTSGRVVPCIGRRLSALKCGEREASAV